MTNTPDAPDMVEPEAIERLPLPALHEQIERPALHRQLAYVAAHSPFYRERFLAAGLSLADAGQLDNFLHLPFSHKADVLADQAAYPPFGRLATGPGREQLLRVHTTSGTTGTPFAIVLTADDAEMTREAGRRAFRCAGLRPSDTVIHCLGYCLWAGGLTDHLSLEATGALVIPFGVGHTRKLIETILTLRPTAISCTPSYLSRLQVVLKDEFGKEPRDLQLRLALCGGEGGLQSPAVRKGVEDTWGMLVADANYGMADVLSIFGAECPARTGLHFHGQGLLLPELIHPETLRSVPLADGAVGELVLTNLRRQAQPLVRYRSGDLIQVTGTGPCACGRHSLRFVPVGRADQMLTVRGVNLYPSAVAAMLAEHPSYVSGEFEIVIDTPPPIDQIGLRVELARGVRLETADAVVTLLLQRCRERLGVTPRIDLLRFGDFPRTEGKTRRVRHLYKETPDGGPR